MPEARKKKVVIIGGGFAGLNAAQTLAKQDAFEVTLLDRSNHHLFQPLLYQVAMAGLSPADIASPIRSVLSSSGVRVLLANVEEIQPEEREVIYSGGKISFDYLVLASGAVHSYFGHPEWEAFAPGLKTLGEATEIRRRVLTAFELAERETDRDLQKDLLTFVVVGGGPTGVELAGALGEISRFTLARDFFRIDPRIARVILIEAGDRILPSFPVKLSQKAVRELESLGVQVWVRSRVSRISAEGVEAGGEKIRSRTVLWAAGVAPSPLGKSFSPEALSSGKVKVASDLSMPSYPNIFVVGDLAHFETEARVVLPGLAPVAMQEGIHAAKNIIADVRGAPRTKFCYQDKGQMATIGRKKAIVDFGKIRLSGFAAWLIWLLVHIFFLIGFRNRVFVLLQWTWSYFRYSKGARLIVGSVSRGDSRLT